MYLNIRELISKSGQVRLREEMHVARLFREQKDVLRVEPLDVDVEAKAGSGVVEVTGTLTLPVEFACSRCLGHYGQRLSIPFHERFTRDRHRSDGEDDDLHVLDDDVVDLTPYVEESVQLGMPYIPVCQPDCKGLNPETGANLNIDPRARPTPRVDPRWEALQQWRDRSED